jgi:hypothetical protein
MTSPYELVKKSTNCKKLLIALHLAMTVMSFFNPCPSLQPQKPYAFGAHPFPHIHLRLPHPMKY